MVLPAVAIPVVLGLIELAGERRGLYGTAVGTGLFAAALASVFLLLLWRSAGAARSARVGERLRDSEARLRLALDAARLGTFELSPATRFSALHRVDRLTPPDQSGQ